MHCILDSLSIFIIYFSNIKHFKRVRDNNNSKYMRTKRKPKGISKPKKCNERKYLIKLLFHVVRALQYWIENSY